MACLELRYPGDDALTHVLISGVGARERPVIVEDWVPGTMGDGMEVKVKVPTCGRGRATMLWMSRVGVVWLEVLFGFLRKDWGNRSLVEGEGKMIHDSGTVIPGD